MDELTYLYLSGSICSGCGEELTDENRFEISDYTNGFGVHKYPNMCKGCFVNILFPKEINWGDLIDDKN